MFVTGKLEEVERKKVKSVRFEESSDVPNVAASLSLDQHKDIAIYTGYCVLKNVMDAMLFCADCADKRLTHPVRTHGRHKLGANVTGSGSETDRSRTCSDSSVSGETEGVIVSNGETKFSEINLQNIYRNNVTVKLQQARSYLASLQPLTFRVEILEDVFSLLFLTHEDLQDVYQASEYHSDEGDDGKSVRSLSTGGATPLFSPLKDNSSVTKVQSASPVKVKNSSEMKLPQVVVNNSAINELTSDYDVPFEEPSASYASVDMKKKVDLEKVGKALETLKTDIVRKRSRNSNDFPNDGRRSSVSENISSMSTSSSINLDTVGYIANEYLVRDILAMLKEAILDVSAARFHIHGSKGDTRERYRSAKENTNKAAPEVDPSIEEALQHIVHSSITIEILQKKITQLERYTSEAHWRYQLVSDENIPRSPGEVLSEVVMATGGSSDEEVEIRGHVTGSKSRKRRVSGMRFIIYSVYE